jgi:hypothetical protein
MSSIQVNVFQRKAITDLESPEGRESAEDRAWGIEHHITCRSRDLASYHMVQDAGTCCSLRDLSAVRAPSNNALRHQRHNSSRIIGYFRSLITFPVALRHFLWRPARGSQYRTASPFVIQERHRLLVPRASQPLTQHRLFLLGSRDRGLNPHFSSCHWELLTKSPRL